MGQTRVVETGCLRKRSTKEFLAADEEGPCFSDFACNGHNARITSARNLFNVDLVFELPPPDDNSVSVVAVGVVWVTSQYQK